MKWENTEAGTRKVRIAINCGGAGKTGCGISNGSIVPPPFLVWDQCQIYAASQERKGTND